MFDHVTIRVSDRAASERFYDTVLAPLGQTARRGAVYTEWNDFSLAQANGEHPVTRGLHVGFGASGPDGVDAFWRAGVDAGFRDDGAPGPRPEYSADYYSGFLLDPDGNSAEAAVHGNLRSDGAIDHLWIRVHDVAASRAFYDAVAPFAGFGLVRDTPELVRYRGASGGSVTFVRGTPTEHVHVAFPAPPEMVDAFHGALVAAGYPNNGAPGERPEYHRGYYAAFVLDPDGHNVELVDHGR